MGIIDARSGGVTYCYGSINCIDAFVANKTIDPGLESINNIPSLFSNRQTAKFGKIESFHLM